MFKFEDKVKAIEIQGMMLVGNEDVHVLYEPFCKELDEKPDVYSVFVHYPNEIDYEDSDLERIADCETLEKAKFIANLIRDNILFPLSEWEKLTLKLNEELKTLVPIFYTDIPKRR